MKVVLLAVRNSLLIDQCDAMHWTGHSRDDYSSRSLWTRSSLAVEPVDQRVDVGARLGAIPWGLRRTGVDGCGLGSRSFKTLRTVLDVGGSPWRSTDQEVGCSSRPGRAGNPWSSRAVPSGCCVLQPGQADVFAVQVDFLPWWSKPSGSYVLRRFEPFAPEE